MQRGAPGTSKLSETAYCAEKPYMTIYFMQKNCPEQSNNPPVEKHIYHQTTPSPLQCIKIQAKQQVSTRQVGTQQRKSRFSQALTAKVQVN